MDVQTKRDLEWPFHASRAISAVGELLVVLSFRCQCIQCIAATPMRTHDRHGKCDLNRREVRWILQFLWIGNQISCYRLCGSELVKKNQGGLLSPRVKRETRILPIRGGSVDLGPNFTIMWSSPAKMLIPFHRYS